MARNYAEEYERERELYRRLTLRIPANMAEVFYAYCENEDIRPTDWILTKIFETVRTKIELNVVDYNGFLFNWNDIVSEMDPAIIAQLREILPPETTNEEFLEQYGEIDPSIYSVIDPYWTPSEDDEEN